MSSLRPVTFLDLPHNKLLLSLEMEELEFKPFSSYKAQNGFFAHAPFWEQGRIDGHEDLYEVSRLNEIVKASPRFYKQHANHEVPEHRDVDTLCCVNILLTDDNAPVHFSGHGDFRYHCALLDVTQPHRVDPWPHERHLLKMSIFDRTYEEVLNDLAPYISDRQGSSQEAMVG